MRPRGRPPGTIPCVGGPKDGTVQDAAFFLVDDVVTYDGAGAPHFTRWTYVRRTINGRDVWLWQQQGPTV